MKKAISYGTRYKIESMDDLNKFHIPEKELADVSPVIAERIHKGPIYMQLVGSEHNYNWIKENLKSVEIDLEIGLEKLKECFDKGEINQEFYDEKFQAFTQLSNKAIGDLEYKIAEYDYYFETYGNYDIIKFSQEY